MKVYEALEAKLHLFLTSWVDKGEWLASCLALFTPRKMDQAKYWVRAWVGPRAGVFLPGIKTASQLYSLFPCHCTHQNTHPSVVTNP